MEVPSSGGKTILVVEDDELVRPSVESLIESLGYQVLSARNGPDALEILRQDTPIDLLFTDVFMPGGMYGPKLVAEARRLRPQLKILYTSGYEDFSPEPGIERLIKPIGRSISRRNCARSSTVTLEGKARRGQTSIALRRRTLPEGIWL